MAYNNHCALLGLLSYSGTVMQSMQLRKQVAWRDMLPLIPFLFIGISIAVWLLVNVNEIILVRVLGMFVLMYAVYSLLPLRSFSGGRKCAYFFHIYIYLSLRPLVILSPSPCCAPSPYSVLAPIKDKGHIIFLMKPHILRSNF